MKSAIELYGGRVNMGCIGEYQPMLNEFGQIVIQVDDSDYQGDSRVLYKKDEMYGYLQFGWGSCCGCDALQACESIEEVQNLMNELHSQIKWMSKEDMLKYFKEHDWKGDYSYHQEETKEFVDKVIKYLEVI
jgi:hypothetical protein